jgi:hypothetical protein
MKNAEGIQRFLDETNYNTAPIYLCPREVLLRRQAHCMDGAVLAAAALEELGGEPLLMDLRATRDDDHVLAIYRRKGCFGAISKSNFSGLRFREPVFRSLRELAMSFFELYFNTAREKTLREYSVLLDLRRFAHLKWQVDTRAMDVIVQALDSARHFRLLTPHQERGLTRVDERSLRAGLMGAAKAGLYKP